MKLFQKHDPKNSSDKLAERAFTHSIVVSVLSIVICLVCLSAATWAWFSGSVTSAPNTIGTQSYTLSLDVKQGGVTLDKGALNENGHYELLLDADTQYTVILSAEGTGKNGYCKIVVGDKAYYTNLVTIENGTEADASFQLTFTNSAATPVRVTFDLCWGTYSGTPHIEADGAYVINVAEQTIAREVVATEE